MHTCMPAASGELAELLSSDTAAGVEDNNLAITTCAVKTTVVHGKGCEGGAACLRRHQEVGKPIPEASRAGAGASAGRIMPIPLCRSPPAPGRYPTPGQTAPERPLRLLLF